LNNFNIGVPFSGNFDAQGGGAIWSFQTSLNKITGKWPDDKFSFRRCLKNNVEIFTLAGVVDRIVVEENFKNKQAR